MDSEQFHTVDPESLKSITVNDILTRQKLSPAQVDYSVPVPTNNQDIPRSNRDSWLGIEMGGVDPATLPQSQAKFRGRIGGC
ncbi:MAG: hypothetical protein KME25_28660 [Symplocastrum torsivum CPER-KK1]|jgi:hypothetical protein|uniref:Uncharacterized protein n=1 Tax=Symplocastrum torsivum CPER-KK1 TaxID=450513 RepID=A0A951PTA6_9CYAN|nr:hypothetical protein [Symplocastrum torsivum CPER-KK1]